MLCAVADGCGMLATDRNAERCEDADGSRRHEKFVKVYNKYSIIVRRSEYEA